jgi:hypothetical protein
VGESVVRDPDLLAVVARIRIEVDVLARRAPGLVRVEAVDDHRERLAPLGPLEHAGGVLVDARGAGLLLVLAASRVGEVLAHAGHVAVVAHERRHPLLDELDRDRVWVAVVARLADDRAPVVPGLAERLVRIGEGEVRVV